MQSREALDLDLRRYLAAIQRSWIPALGVFCATVGLSYWYSTQLQPTYGADTKLLFRVSRISTLTRIGEGQDETQLRSLLLDQSPLNSEIEIMASRPLLQQTIDRLNLKDEEGKRLSPEVLRTQLEIKIVGATDVVQISYENPDPEKAAAVVNTLANLYIDNNSLVSQSEATDARQFIDDQLPKSEANVREVELELRRFREKNNVVSLSDETTSAVALLQNLDNQIVSARAELEEANAKSGSLRHKIAQELNPRDAVAVSSLSQAPAVQNALGQLQEVDRKLAMERIRFTESSPTIARLVEQQTALRNLVQREIQKVASGVQVNEGQLQLGELRQTLINNYLSAEVQRLSVARRLDSLERSKQQYQNRVNVLPKLEQEQRELERRLEAAQATYEALLTKLQELQVKERQVQNNVRVIEPAVVPVEPQGGGKTKFLAIGIVAGGILSLTVIILGEVKEILARSGDRRRLRQERELPDLQPEVPEASQN